MSAGGNFLLQAEAARRMQADLLTQARADGHEVIGDMVIVRDGSDAIGTLTVRQPLPPAPNRIRELRTAKLWTQRQLAGRARVALRTVWSVEHGLPCRMATKQKLLGAFGLEHTEWVNVWPCEVRQKAL